MNILIEQINAYFNSGGTKTKSFVGKICEAAIYMDSDEFYTTLGRMFFWKFSLIFTHSLIKIKKFKLYYEYFFNLNLHL